MQNSMKHHTLQNKKIDGIKYTINNKEKIRNTEFIVFLEY